MRAIRIGEERMPYSREKPLAAGSARQLAGKLDALSKERRRVDR
jgi:hypothetical protein